jgi:hypothetical protein
MPCVMSIIRDRDIALVFRRRAARPARCASGSWFIITLSLCTVQMLPARAVVGPGSCALVTSQSVSYRVAFRMGYHTVYRLAMIFT